MPADPDGFPVASRYAITTDFGEHELAKEFYGTGPAQFVWRLTRSGSRKAGREFRTRRDALASVTGG